MSPSETVPSRYFFAGAPFHPGTRLPANVTGDCPHRHKTAEAARRCIEDTDRAIKRGNGPDAYCDRQVMVWTPERGRVPLASDGGGS